MRQEHFIQTRAVYDKTPKKAPDLGDIPGYDPDDVDPDLFFPPYTFDLFEVVAYRQTLDRHGKVEPYTCIYFRSSDSQTIDVPYDKFDTIFKAAHIQRAQENP